jgi:hypothetical protein
LPEFWSSEPVVLSVNAQHSPMPSHVMEHKPPVALRRRCVCVELGSLAQCIIGATLSVDTEAPSIHVALVFQVLDVLVFRKGRGTI